MRPIQGALHRLRNDRLAHSGLHRRGDDGFGMIDCIVAMVILLGVLIPAGYLFTNVLSQAASARQRITALSVAEQWIENLNNSGPAADSNNQPEVGTSFSEPSSTLSGITYSVTARFKWTDASGGTPDFCTTAISPVLGLQVTVSWGLGQSITDQAILNFPASGNLTDGYLAIQVDGDPAGSPPVDVFNNAWSSRVQNVPVQVSGSNLTTPYSLTPDSNGCTFLQLSPGTYTVQVGPGPTSSYVANYNESSSETQALANQSSITVTDAEITEVEFQYDEGANVALAYPSTTVTDDGIVCSTNAGPILCLAMGQSASSSSSPNSSPVAVGLVQKSSGWSTVSFPSTMTRVQDADCTTTACIAVGYNSSGGAAAISTNGTTWTNSTLPSGVTDLTNIICPPSATTPACLAIGSGTSSTGVLLTVTISGSTANWTKDTVTGATSLSQIVCPSSAAQPICFVTGTTSSGATIFSNTGSAAPGTTWHAYTLSVTMTSISSITCTSTTWCAAVGMASSTPEAITITSVSGTTVTWKAFTTTGFTMSTFNTVACYLSSAHDFCQASGTGKIGSGAVGPIVIYCNNSSGSVCQTSTTASAWKNDTVPTGLTGISALTCPSTATTCFALDTTSSGAGVISLASGATAWSSAALPAGALSLSTLACPTATACYAMGTSSTAAIVDVLKSGSWSSASFTGTTGGSPVNLSGLVCTAATTCEAAGATESAAQIFDYANSTVSFSAANTPTALTSPTSLYATSYGLYLDNPPIMVSNSNLEPNSTIEMSAPTTSNGPQTQVGPLFPFQAGYSIAAGYCASELTTASASASTTPGALFSTSPSSPTVVLPMGLLPIEATNAAGTSVLSGATVSIADASCTSSLELTPLSSGSYPALSSPPANPSNPTSYSMPTTGVDGLSRIAVIYGTYVVTVTSGATHATTTVTVNPTSIVVGATTYYMPAFVPIPD